MSIFSLVKIVKAQKSVLLLVIAFFFFNACGNEVHQNKMLRNEGHKSKVLQHEKLQNLRNDYNFYKKIDLFDKKAIDSINIEDTNQILNFPYYGFKVKKDEIDVAIFYSRDSTDYEDYKVTDSCLISTVYQDGKKEGEFNRTLKIITSTKEIDNEYRLVDNYEYLKRIVFKYPDGTTRVYLNSDDKYYGYSATLDEKNIKAMYPAMELDKKN